MISENEPETSGKMSGDDDLEDGPPNEFTVLMRSIVPLLARRWAVLRHVVGPEVDALKYYAARVAETEKE